MVPNSLKKGKKCTQSASQLSGQTLPSATQKCEGTADLNKTTQPGTLKGRAGCSLVRKHEWAQPSARCGAGAAGRLEPGPALRRSRDRPFVHLKSKIIFFKQLRNEKSLQLRAQGSDVKNKPALFFFGMLGMYDTKKWNLCEFCCICYNILSNCIL